ncbi:hypothetical protein ACC724_39140, partial [Rhizobium ruizarguesonis]
HDVFFSERTLHANGAAAIRTAINDLTFKGYVYKGTLPPPKGQLPEDWEDRGRTIGMQGALGEEDVVMDVQRRQILADHHHHR